VVFERDGSIRIKNPSLSSIFDIKGDITDIKTCGIEPEGLATSEVVKMEKTIEIKGQRRWVLWRIVYDSHMDLYYATVFDITEQKMAEVERIEKERLEAFRMSAYGFAHDFNNLLTGILGSIELIQMSSEPQMIEKSMQRLYKSALMARDMVEQLLLFARAEMPARKTLIQPGEIVSDTVRFYTEDKNLQVHLEIARDLWPVRVDETQFRQMVLNLVVNALDAMPEGGTLTVEASNYRKDDTSAYIRIVFKDTGKGIEPEQVSRIFQPFFYHEAKRHRPGTCHCEDGAG
jgi:signal transduction histidine kinase